ncbi:MAG: class-II fumarase/aspartase family protein [Ruegeria sp.]
MVGSVFDSPLFSHLFPTGEVGRLFTDSAELRAMLLVEGMLAKAQGDLGVIPQDSAQAITRAAMEVQLDPGALSQATGQNGVSVPALVAAFRSEMQAPEHAAFVHWGATSQDIIDTGLMLRMRQSLGLIEADLKLVLNSLATMATTHATLAMAARTYGQHATLTSFGAVAANWGAPLLALCDELPELRQNCLLVSLSGAAGTSNALGPSAPETRRALAELLNLNDPERSWHTDRTPILRLCDWFTRLTLALGKLGEDLIELTQTGIQEVSIGGGSSSTMPQKQNPVTPSVLVAVSRQQTGLMGVLQNAAVHRHQRDGAAWFTEWMCLPQIVLGAAASAHVAVQLVPAIQPDAKAMESSLSSGLGLIHAEALSFALSQHMPRPEAQAATKSMCQEAGKTGHPLKDIVTREWPQLDLTRIFDAQHQLGQAPAEAQAFAKRVRERLSDT